ncbi:hypothetical protein TREMEDRAFT_31568 [Tremella mesenterica DSM 1558]|uniref:uncharacterized protein n=1 Tax=Tremella mesenterica (strain ATCC 24925 / CBS 8224 / DSM 1558 / NBRC 9311 / NRRL Y-6157 / RJB 2259-6 / UBC 559-6) TaxID=578456 RepID=UPI0003F4A303|nr:uncharacterized protein TREMEDRAFT_31568 [Tremella mesenterica DSM 1558]EIW69074.1 hypothetical protein TREMEDRAFT_31568 [Tremella mesenterica DSM 1558]
MNPDNNEDSSLQLLFMGTGTSTGLPLIPCLTLSAPYPSTWHETVPLPSSTPDNPPVRGAWDPSGDWPKNIPCASCRSAVDKDVPEGWKNKRGNTSLLLRKKDSQGQWKNVIVDVGKTFNQQAEKLFPVWGVKSVDAVILTHGHADAYLGLDDLREWCIRLHMSIPIYLTKATYDTVADSFPYLVDATKASGGGDIPSLIWIIIEEESEFDIFGIHIHTFSVHHGIYFHEGATDPLICLGFIFDHLIAYIADVSHIPEKSWEILLNPRRVHSSLSSKMNGLTLEQPSSGPFSTSTSDSNSIPIPILTNQINPSLNHIDPASNSGSGLDPQAKSKNDKLAVLIIDALWPLRSHTSHYNLRQALLAAERLRPCITYLVGSTHPTSHYMWERLCQSISDIPPKVVNEDNHPDEDVASIIVDKFWYTQPDEKEKQLLDQWGKEGAKIEPAYDGLMLELQRDSDCMVIDPPERYKDYLDWW